MSDSEDENGLGGCGDDADGTGGTGGTGGAGAPGTGDQTATGTRMTIMKNPREEKARKSLKNDEVFFL